MPLESTSSCRPMSPSSPTRPESPAASGSGSRGSIGSSRNAAHPKTPACSTMEAQAIRRRSSSLITPSLLRKMDAYWRAANYLSVGQIYLYDNPLLRQPLRLEHIKPRLLGHWGTTPGLNFVYVHLNRIIKQYDLDMIFVTGPGHGGPGLVANTYLEGTYSEIYPDVSQD